MPKVYIVNRSGHDMSDAERFGRLVYITEKRVDRFNANDMLRQAAAAFEDAESEDYILITSLTILCSICCAAFARKFGRLNLLLYKNEKYIVRKIEFDYLLGIETLEEEVIRVEKTIGKEPEE